MHLLSWLGICLWWSVQGGGDLIGKYNLKSVHTNKCCIGETNIVSCNYECPAKYDEHFFLFKEGLSYTFACADKKSWVVLSKDKLSGGRAWKCAKEKPAEFEVRVASQNDQDQNEYVILLADGTGACNMEPEFFHEGETKIECHKGIPKGRVESAFKFLLLDDLGNSCQICGEDDSGKNPEQMKKIEEMRKKQAEARKKKKEAEAIKRQEAAARMAKAAKAANTTNGECMPCECDAETIKKAMSGVIDFDIADIVQDPKQDQKAKIEGQPQKVQPQQAKIEGQQQKAQLQQANAQQNTQIQAVNAYTQKAPETSVASSANEGWRDFELTAYVLLLSHFCWIYAYFTYWRKLDRASDVFTADLLNEMEY